MKLKLISAAAGCSGGSGYCAGCTGAHHADLRRGGYQRHGATASSRVCVPQRRSSRRRRAPMSLPTGTGVNSVCELRISGLPAAERVDRQSNARRGAGLPREACCRSKLKWPRASRCIAGCGRSTPKDAIDRTFKQDLIEKFEDGGATLPPDKRKRAQQIVDEIERLSLQYSKNANEDPDHGGVDAGRSRRHAGRMDRRAQARCERQSGADSRLSDGCAVHAERHQ